MSESKAKVIERNRAPRVQIAYDVEHYGSPTTIELPFVMGVMADLAGSSETREAMKAPSEANGTLSTTGRRKTLKAQSMSRTRRPKSRRTTPPQVAAIARRGQGSRRGER